MIIMKVLIGRYTTLSSQLQLTRQTKHVPTERTSRHVVVTVSSDSTASDMQ